MTILSESRVTTTVPAGAEKKVAGAADVATDEWPPQGLTEAVGTSPRQARRRRFVTRKRVLWACAILLTAGAIATMFRPTPVVVEMATLVRGPLEVTVDAEGVTRVRDRYLVAAPVTGRVERIALREGDEVTAGSVVARVTPAPLDPQTAAHARARIAAAEAALQEVEARLAQSTELRAQVERSTVRIRAVAAEGAMSVDALDRAEAQLANAVREEEATASRLRAAHAELAAARAALLGQDSRGQATAIVRSPANGRVLGVFETSERVVPAGTPLVAVGDPTGLEVVVDVLSTDAVRVRPGAIIRLVEWGGNAPLEARVRLVEPSAFTKVSALGVEEQRVNVIGDLIGAPPALGDAFRVQARIVTWQADVVLKVPTTALFRSADGWAAFVVDGGRARLRQVQIGHRGAGEAEVLGGVGPGDPVVLFPSDQVAEGVRVRARY